MGRRELKKRATRRALSDAALRLAARLGPAQVTVEAIAEEADVSVRTFFNYFSSKDAAIVGFDPDHYRDLAERLLERPAAEAPFVALRNVFVQLYEEPDRVADRLVRRHRLVRQHPSLMPGYLAAHAEMESALTEAMARRLGLSRDQHLEPALFVSSGVGVLRLAVTWWDARGRTPPLSEVLDEAFATLVTGDRRAKRPRPRPPEEQR